MLFEKQYHVLHSGRNMGFVLTGMILSILLAVQPVMAAGSSFSTVSAEEKETEMGLMIASGVEDILVEQPETAAPVPEETAQAPQETKEETKPELVQPSTELIDAHPDFLLSTVDAEGDFVYIREEPDTESEWVGKLYVSATGSAVERGEEWTLVHSGSVEGWVKNEYIMVGDDAYKKAVDTATRIATVSADGLLVRDEMSSNGSVLTAVYEGERYEVLSEENGWLGIRCADGTEGYISQDFVKIENVFTEAVSREEEEAAIRREEERRAAEAAAAEEAAAAAAAAQQSSNDYDYSYDSGTSASYDELYIMACMLQAEAGFNYEGCLAVANCIMNRVYSPMFPNTITDVIYQPHQFATNSYFYDFMAQGPSATAMQAAQDAVNGVNILGGYLFFRSSRTAQYDSYSSWVNIGGNVYYTK